MTPSKFDTGIADPNLTAGSIVFVGTGGVFSADHANFVVDDTNIRLGIGTSPSYGLDVSTAGALLTGNLYDLARFVDTGGAGKGIHLGFDNTTQTGIIAAATASAASGVAIWGYNGAAWGPYCTFSAGGQQFGADSTYDLGAASTGRPRDIFGGRDAVITRNFLLTGSCTKYNADLTAGNGLASVVASVTRSAQTGSITATSLWTPPANGTYLVDLYLVTTTAGSGGTCTVTLTWTDDAGAQTFTSSTIALSTLKSLYQISLPIRALTSASIKYSTTVSGASGSPQYELCVDVIRKS